jgi:hypothetical protein
VIFADEDVIEHHFATGAWEVTYDGSAEHAAWEGSDLDAIALPELHPLLALVAGVGTLLALRRSRNRP